MFDEVKIAQATAYLLNKAGGTMEHLKMMKLLYLADRLSWDKYGYAISNDEYFSLPFGPVLSQTLNLMRGETQAFYQNVYSGWREWIADKADHKISLRKAIDESDEYFWDRLSASDVEVLDEIFKQFGNYSTFALVEYTHNPKFIPEWEDPNGSSKPITLDTLLTKLGKSQEEISTILDDLNEQREFDRLFQQGGF